MRFALGLVGCLADEAAALGSSRKAISGVMRSVRMVSLAMRAKTGAATVPP